MEVATKLNLSGSTVQQYYIQYWKLENMYELNEIYNEIKDNMGHFVELVRLAKKEHLTPEEVIGLINLSNDIQDLKRQHKQLNVGIVELESKLYANKDELKRLKYQITEATNLIEIKSENIERKS
jgi:uncharacterized protein involved in exopolysaccharide biosynthesis